MRRQRPWLPRLWWGVAPNYRSSLSLRSTIHSRLRDRRSVSLPLSDMTHVRGPPIIPSLQSVEIEAGCQLLATATTTGRTRSQRTACRIHASSGRTVWQAPRKAGPKVSTAQSSSFGEFSFAALQELANGTVAFQANRNIVALARLSVGSGLAQ